MRKLLGLLVATALVGATTVALASAAGTGPKITPSAETANAYLMPGDHPCINDWLYYGCDAGGTAYSQLTQINKTNVGQLRVAWDKGFAIPQYSSPVETQPMCCPNGLMYVPTPTTTVAVRPDTGD